MKIGKIWASYNTGWSYNSKTGLDYSADVFNIKKNSNTNINFKINLHNQIINHILLQSPRKKSRNKIENN